MKKDAWKWCEFHKSPSHNIDECHTKQSLVAEIKALESNEYSKSKPKIEKGKQIIDAKPSATISTTKVKNNEPKDPYKGEHLSTHKCGLSILRYSSLSIVRVKRTSYQQRLLTSWAYRQHHTCQHAPSSGSNKGNISTSTKISPFPTTSSVSQMRYFVMLLPLKFVMFYQPNHTCRSIMLLMNIDLILLLLLWEKNLYRIPKVPPPTAIYFIFVMQCNKIIQKTGKIVLFLIHSQSKQKIMAPRNSSFMQQNKVYKVMEEYMDIFPSLIGVPLHCQVKHSIDLTLESHIPNDPIYRYSLLENKEIVWYIQEFL